MITIRKTKNYKFIKELLSDKRTFKACFGSDDYENLKIDKSFKYYLIQHEQGTIGYFILRELNKQIVEGHFCILSKYWGSSLTKQAAKASLKFLKRNTKYIHLFTTVPLQCEIVHKFAYEIGWKVCGKISEGIGFNGVLMDLILYSLDLRGIK